MRYYVSSAVDAATGERYVLGLARRDETATELFSTRESQWVNAPSAVRDEIDSRYYWEPVTDEDELAAIVRQLPVDQQRWQHATVDPGYWLTVTRTDDEPKLLLRSTDGRSLEGYAVSSARWEPMPQPVTPTLNDPRLWQRVPEGAVADVQTYLHLLWDLREQADFNAQAPALVDPQLSEAAARRNIVHYIVEILKLLPTGLVVGFQEPGHAPGSVSSGPVGPGGSWNLEASYRVWGFPRGPASDQVFDAFKRLFDAWGWTHRYADERGSRHLDARTDDNRKHAYHVTLSRYPHGGVSLRWTSPYFPARYADTGNRAMGMPSVITKDGIQSWEPPVFEDFARIVPGGFTELTHFYNRWRRIAELAGSEPYDQADWESGRLHFRSDYVGKLAHWPQWRETGDWAAWIVEPTLDGHYNVLRSLMPERSNNRQETVEAVFARLEDAGKYIIARIGDYVRLDLKLPTLAAAWDDAGPDPRIETAAADTATLDYWLAVQPDTDRHFAAQHLRVYRLRDKPAAYGWAFPSKEPYMRVLALSFEELDKSLTEGMPESVTVQLKE